MGSLTLQLFNEAIVRCELLPMPSRNGPPLEKLFWIYGS